MKDFEFEMGLGRATVAPRPTTHDQPQVIRAGGQSGAAAAILNTLCQEARVERLAEKVDRAVELAERVAARRNAPPLKGPDTTQGPTAGQLTQQWRRDYEARAARICAESEAAYTARNPHKREDKR